MSGNSVFQMVDAHGWRGGLNNLFRLEFGKWWKANLWWIQALIWVVVINGILAPIIWSPEGAEIAEGTQLYAVFSGLFTSIAVVIIMQDAIVGEVEAGTAAWVLSKPASRSSFILAKWVANLFGVLVTMLVLPGIVAYLQISLAGGEWLDPFNFALGIGALWVYLAYYLTLTLMLGTFFHHRGPVIGIPLALAFGQQMLFGLLPSLSNVLPWVIAVPAGEFQQSIASAYINAQQPFSTLPLVVTLVSIFIFLGLSLWRFEKEEL